MKPVCRWIVPAALSMAGLHAAAFAASPSASSFAASAASSPMESPAPAAPLPHPLSGHVERLPAFAPTLVEPRPVDVWLPDSYGRDPARRYPVVYMHDGQNVFDGAQVPGPWGGWRVESAIARLAARGAIREAIVVAVWNTGAHRYSEYYPVKALPFVDEPKRGAFVATTLAGRARGDDYLRFLVEQVKPEIDRRYRTLPGRADTMVMGSSMGGLVSAYAISEYPEVFGGAACLSLHWVGSQLPGTEYPLASLAYFQRHLPAPADHRIYADAGDQGLDANYAAPLAMMDAIAADHGYDAAHWRSLRFPGRAHNETAWRERLDEPLMFLLGKR